VRKVRDAVADGDVDKATTLLAAATSQLDRAAGKNLIHANKARRTKSRLNKLVNKSAQ